MLNKIKSTTIALAAIASLIFSGPVFSQSDTAASTSTISRSLPNPLPAPPFPSGDWVGPVIGEAADAPDWAVQKALGLANDKSRIKIYGWVAPSYNISTSKNSNVPLSYAIVPNSFQLDQAVLRIERQPNTVQTDHFDWGFRISNVYGIDYRYITAKGWFSNQYFKKNNLYGYDNPETYVMLYFPKVAEGMVVTVGRFISPPDIEAQLATNNYLFTHSVMFTYDPFTFTGVQSTIRLTPHWSIEFAVDAGNDMAPWVKSASLTGQAFVRWISNNDKDGIWAGVNALGPNWKYSYGHDNLQMVAGTWGHKFNEGLHMMTEIYYDWEKDAALGGSASYGPVQYAAGGGPGPIIPGISNSLGVVNYFQILIGNRDKSYLTIRNDYLNDFKGWRTGYATTYLSHTIGFIHNFTEWITIRPEIRYDYNVGNKEIKPYDLGGKSSQFFAGSDLIVRF
jgi:Putative beta-barrel porin-2, OmpL-like. bbp2